MVKASVHGIISGIPMPFPFPQPDACVDSGLACPLQNGQDYTYTTQIPISSSYPKVDVSWFSILSRVLPGSRGSDKVGSRQTEGFFCSRCVFLEDKFEIVNRYGMDFPVNNFYTNILRPILFY